MSQAIDNIAAEEQATDNLTVVEQALLTRIAGEGPQGFDTKQEALDAGRSAGIASPGAVPFNNRFFFTDPTTSAPTGTFNTRQEAVTRALTIGRPDLVVEFDEDVNAFRLRGRPSSGIQGMEFSPDLGQFVVTFADGRTQLVKPPPTGGTSTEPFGTTPIPGTDFVLLDDGQGGTSVIQKSETERANFNLGDIQQRGQFQFVETSPGTFQRLPDEQQEGQVVNVGGREFIQQPDGSLQPLAPEAGQTLQQMRAKALATGNVDAALAFDDFINRPTSLESFNAAMQFAQSPGDVFSISNIARGQTQIDAPEAGQTQRIADPPQFLQDTFTRLMNQFKGGTGTPNDFVSIMQSFATSQEQEKQARVQAQDELATNQQAERDRVQAERDTTLKDAIARADAAEKALQAGAKPSATPPTSLTPAGAAGVAGQDTTNLNQSQIDLINRFNDPATTLPVPPATPSPVPAADIPTNVPPPEEATEAVSPPTFFDQSAITDEDDFFAHGGVFDDQTAIVGEEGPELLIAKPGSRVIPIDGKNNLAALRSKFKMRSLSHGGILDPLLDPSPDVLGADSAVDTGQNLPFGVRQVLRGGSIEPTRRRLSRAAGIPVLSGQVRQNLLPEELDVFDRLRAEAGIPQGAFEQEQRSALPGALRGRPSRFAARRVR